MSISMAQLVKFEEKPGRETNLMSHSNSGLKLRSMLREH